MKMWRTWLGVLGILQAVVAVCAGCETSSYKVDNTCPTDCSQKMQRVSGDFTRFNCTIGGIDRITKYREANEGYFQSEATPIFGAPTLQDIWFYKKNYSDGCRPNPALAIKFMLPKGVQDPDESSSYLLPQAVMMNFQGVRHEDFADLFYSDNPRQRIFQFHHYTPNTTYDVYNPRSLVFDCLVGLEEASDERVGQLKVYNITLTTVQGKSVLYTVTVNVFYAGMTDARTQAARQLVLATSVMAEGGAGGTSIHLVIQTVPNIDRYIVLLLKQGHNSPVEKESLLRGSNSVVFHNVGPGTYTINVSVRSRVCPNNLPCMNSTSYSIHITSPLHDSVHYADSDENYLKVVAMVMGCLVGTCLLLLVAFIILRRGRKGKTTVHGWVLHPYKPGTNENEVVDRLTEYLAEACNCCLEKCLPEDWNQDTSDNKLRDRCDMILGKRAKFTIIVSAKDVYRQNAACTYEDFYSYSVAKAVDTKKKQNSMWIFAVDFSFSKAPIPSVLKETPYFHLLPNLSGLREKITELNDLPSSSDPLMAPDILLKFSALERAIKKLEHTVPKQVPHNTERPAMVQTHKPKTGPPREEEPNLKNSIPDEMKEMMKAFNVSDEDLRFGMDDMSNGDCGLENSDYVTADEYNRLLPKNETVPCNSAASGIKKEMTNISKPTSANADYLSTTSPQMPKKELYKDPDHQTHKNEYVSTTSPPMQRKEPFQSPDAPCSNNHAKPADHSQAQTVCSHKDQDHQASAHEQCGYITGAEAQNMHDRSDMVVRQKHPNSMVRQHSGGSGGRHDHPSNMDRQPSSGSGVGYVGHDFVEKYPDQQYTPHTSTRADHPGYHRQVSCPSTVTGKPYVHVAGRRGVGHCNDYIMPHEAMAHTSDHHDPRLTTNQHVDAHFHTRMPEVNFNGQKSRGYAEHSMFLDYDATHVPYNTSQVPYNASKAAYDLHHVPFDNNHTPYVDPSMLQDHGIHSSWQGSEAIEMSDRCAMYPCHRNIATQDHNPHRGGHNPYVDHAEIEDRNLYDQGFLGGRAQYTDNPEGPLYYRNQAEDVDGYGYMPEHPAMCQRQVSNRSASLLSSDHSLEYETSFDPDSHSYNHIMLPPMETNPSGYVDHDIERPRHMEMNPSGYVVHDMEPPRMIETNSSGYVDHDMVRPRPMGSSDNSLTAAQLSFTAVDPLSLEQTIKRGSKDSETVSDGKRRSKTPPASGFTEAVALEPQLREEYEQFEPIPPEDEASTCGSITDLMQSMGRINSS